MWNEFIWALIHGKHHIFSQVAPLLISLFSELCNALSRRKNASQVLQTNHESPAWSMRIVDKRQWWHFWSVFYDVGLLPYARRGHTRHDAHCRSHARNVLKVTKHLLCLPFSPKARKYPAVSTLWILEFEFPAKTMWYCGYHCG